MRAMTRNFVLVTGSRALDGAVRFLTVPVVLGYFGRTDFGLIALAFSMQGFLMLADYGLSVNAVRRLTEFLQQERFADVERLASSASFFYALVGLTNLGALVVVGYFGQSWFELDDRHAAEFFWMMLALGCSSALMWAFSIYRQILQAAALVGWEEAVNLVASVLTLLAVWSTLHWQLSPAAYFALVLVPPLVPMIIRMQRVQRLIPGFRIGMSPNWRLFRPLVGTSLWLFVLMSAQLLADNYRPVILSQGAGLESVAEYRIIQQISGFALLLLSGCMSVIYPVIARLDAGQEHTRISTAAATGSRLLLWGHLLVLVTMAFMSEWLLRVYVGAEFTHLAGPLAIWLLTLVAYHNAVLTSIALSRGQLAVLVVGAVLGAILTLVLAQHLAPTHGVLAMVCSYAAHIALQLAATYFVAAPLAGAGSGWRLAQRVMTRPLLCAAGSAALAFWAVDLAQAGYWFGALVFVVAFVSGAFTFGRVGRDWQELRQRPA